MSTTTDLIRALKIPGYGDDEVGFIEDTVTRLRPTHIFEWGTNRGSSARIFYETAKLAGVDCEIHTVELPHGLSHMSAEHPGADMAFYVLDIDEVHKHQGDGVMVALALHADLKPERALFFIDGDHSPYAVARELRLIGQTAPNAVLLLHDTNHPAIPGPTGPAEAVEEWMRERGHGYEVTVLESQAGMTRLWPR